MDVHISKCDEGGGSTPWSSLVRNLFNEKESHLRCLHSPLADFEGEEAKRRNVLFKVYPKMITICI